MKILRVTSSGFQEGGAEIGIVHMQSVLETRGHTIRTLASDARPDMPHFNYYSYRAPGSGLRKLMHTWNPYAYAALTRALHDFRPDVVHLHTLGAASPAVLFAVRKYPTVATVHGPEGYTKELLPWCMPKTDFGREDFDMRYLTSTGRLRYFYYRWINYPLYRLGMRNVDAFVTISSYITRLMSGQGIESVYIPNGLQLLPAMPLTPTNISHALVFSGRLEKFKGLEYVLKALPEVLALFPDTVLRVAGDGTELAALKRQAQEFGISDAVVFLGRIPHGEVPQLYARSTLALVPSIWPEVCSRGGIEALSVGRPVIGTNVGGTPDWLIDGATGYLVPPKDPPAIAAAIIKAFSNTELLVSMSLQARQKAEEYAIERHADEIEQVYRRVIGAAA